MKTSAKIFGSVLTLLTVSLFAQTNETLSKASSKAERYVGSRSSQYGFKPFPEPEEIASVYQKMSAKVPGSTPASAWIVGVIGKSECRIGFPNPSTTPIPNIVFSRIDKNEAYLQKFDEIGAKIFLQVEPGMADVPTLIKLVLDQYGHHPCIAGFGVDIEWYPSSGETNGDPTGMNKKLTNEELLTWDSLVKSYNPSYRVFVKHWIPSYCGTSGVSDVIYIDDTQGYSSASGLLTEFKKWAKRFAPNEVGFQIGYPRDTTWWTSLKDPLVEMTNTIDQAIPNQTCHIFWVDFTLRRPELNEYWLKPESTVPQNKEVTVPSSCTLKTTEKALK